MYLVALDRMGGVSVVVEVTIWQEHSVPAVGDPIVSDPLVSALVIGGFVVLHSDAEGVWPCSLQGTATQVSVRHGLGGLAEICSRLQESVQYQDCVRVIDLLILSAD